MFHSIFSPDQISSSKQPSLLFISGLFTHTQPGINLRFLSLPISVLQESPGGCSSRILHLYASQILVKLIPLNHIYTLAIFNFTSQKLCLPLTWPRSFPPSRAAYRRTREILYVIKLIPDSTIAPPSAPLTHLPNPSHQYLQGFSYQVSCFLSQAFICLQIPGWPTSLYGSKSHLPSKTRPLQYFPYKIIPNFSQSLT